MSLPPEQDPTPTPVNVVTDPVPSTDPPLQPEHPVTFEPGLWYSATVTCPAPTCPNYNRVWDVPELPPNCPAYCGLSNNPITFLTATPLDPQPAEE